MPLDGVRGERLERFQSYDQQTVERPSTGDVDHRASALENLKAVARDVVNAVDPTNRFRDRTHGSCTANDRRMI